MADVDATTGKGNCLLTCEDLRRILDQFARETFREEFSELRSQVLEEIKKEFQGLKQNGAVSKMPDRASGLRFTAGINVIKPPSPAILCTQASDETPPKGKKRGVTWAEAPIETDAKRGVTWADDPEIDEKRASHFSQDGEPRVSVKAPRVLVKSKTQMKSLDHLKIEAQKKATKRKKKLTMVEHRTNSSLGSGGKREPSAGGRVTRANFARSASRLVPSRRSSGSWKFLRRFDGAASIGEAIIIVFIILNGLFIGIQTDYHARELTEDVPTVFEVMEILFCVVFTTELILKLGRHRHKFYCMPGWTWNLFDSFLVLFQLIEVVGMLAGGDTDAGGVNFSFVRLLKILRLFRILRLVRLLHFIDELAVIISSIGRSFMSLCWTVFLLLILMYMVGVVFCQIVFTHRVTRTAVASVDDSQLALYWGDVVRSVLTLYQATMGGIDWGQTMDPLGQQISPLLSVAFCLYIAFVLLAVMNVITGTFVQSAVKDAEKDKIQDFLYAANRAFSGGSSNAVCPEQVTFEDFATMVEGELSGWLTSMNIKQEDAKLIFYLLDKKQDQRVQTSDLIESLCRLREGAQFMDIMKVMYEYERQSEAFEDLLNDMADVVVEQVNPETQRTSSALMARSATGSFRAALGSDDDEVVDVSPKTPPGRAAQLQHVHPFGANHYSGDNPNESEWEIEEV